MGGKRGEEDLAHRCWVPDVRFEISPHSPLTALPCRSKGDRPSVSPPPLAISPGGAAPRMYVHPRVLYSALLHCLPTIRLESARRFPLRGDEEFFMFGTPCSSRVPATEHGRPAAAVDLPVDATVSSAKGRRRRRAFSIRGASRRFLSVTKPLANQLLAAE